MSLLPLNASINSTSLKFLSYNSVKVQSPKEKRYDKIIKLLEERGDLSRAEIGKVFEERDNTPLNTTIDDLAKMVKKRLIFWKKHGVYSLDNVDEKKDISYF